MSKPESIELNISDRVTLLNVLPPQGNAMTLRILQELRTELGFSEEEMKKFKMTNTFMPDGSIRIQWDEDFANATKEIEIGKFARGVIIRRLKKLDREQMLNVNMLPLYEIFVEEKDGKETKKKED